jgi:hypothetical protein
MQYLRYIAKAGTEIGTTIYWKCKTGAVNAYVTTNPNY